MRIALVTESLYRGGISVYMLRLADGLRKLGHETVFVTRKCNYPISKDGEILIAHREEEYQYLGYSKADIYHYHSGVSANCSFDNALTKAGKPVVETVHSFGQRHHLQHLPLEMKVFVSKHQAESALKPGELFVRIPPPFPVEKLAALDVEHADTDVIRIGMMASRRDMGVDTALDAVHNVRDSTGKCIELVLFGVDSPDSLPLRSWCDHLPDWVHVHPWMPHESLVELMSGCDIGLHAAPREECWCQAATEWMLLGRPLIINYRAVFDLIDNNCLQFQDAQSLEKAITECLDPMLRNEVGTEGRANASPFTVERCAKAYETLYKDVVARATI